MKNLKLTSLSICLFCSLVLIGLSCKPSAENKEITYTADAVTNPLPPNIVFILIDDIGVISTPPYSANLDGSQVVSASLDTGYVKNGASYHPYTTPNINKLASESLVFTKMYSTPLCAPSRGQIMTGLYPFQTGVVFPAYSGNVPASPENPGSGPLNPDFTTYPKHLKESADYFTGFGGKWNLRWGISDFEADHDEGPYPYSAMVDSQRVHLNRCGFTETFNPNALIGHTIDYYPPQLHNKPPGYLPFAINTWAQEFLEAAKTNIQMNDQPFYLHYCPGLIHDEGNAVHNIPGYSDNGSSDIHFGNKIHVVDSLIGLVIDKVQNDPFLSKNTIIIVAGDNGTEEAYTTKYRGNDTPGGKYSPKSYGSNVPFIVNWPGTLSAGTYSQLADFADIHATITDIAGIGSTSSNTSGVSFLANMKLPASSRTEIRNYIYSQASNLHSNPTVPSGVNLGNPVAFIANQNYSLIPTHAGGALFSIDPITLQDVYLCQNGCPNATVEYQNAYCELYQELIELGPDTRFVPYNSSYKCNS